MESQQTAGASTASRGNFGRLVAPRPKMHGINPFDDLATLLRHERAVAERPNEWLPWNYAAAVAGLTAA